MDHWVRGWSMKPDVRVLPLVLETVFQWLPLHSRSVSLSRRSPCLPLGGPDHELGQKLDYIQNQGAEFNRFLGRTDRCPVPDQPLLERKRRARINRCLEELKQLIRELTYMDAEALAKLEKADFLELTVHPLHRYRSSPDSAMERYWSGFRQFSLEESRDLQTYDSLLSNTFQKAIEQIMSSQPRL